MSLSDVIFLTMSLYLYLVDRLNWDVDYGHESYASFVACAHNAEEARHLHPDGQRSLLRVNDPDSVAEFEAGQCWIRATELTRLMVTPLGVAYPHFTNPSVILSKYNGDLL